MKQLIVGFTTEGKTDERFLRSVILHSFEDVAFECASPVEILPVQYLERRDEDFIEVVKCYAEEADKSGVMVLCIHADADAPTDAQTIAHKIAPAFAAVQNIIDRPVCKNLAAIVPVQMMEAWMLGDKNLLKAEIGTNQSDAELGLHKNPEAYSHPKQIIEDAIRIARKGVAKRRRRDLTISELYSPIGQKIALAELEKLPSYRKFKEEVKRAFRKLNYFN